MRGCCQVSKYSYHAKVDFKFTSGWLLVLDATLLKKLNAQSEAKMTSNMS